CSGDIPMPASVTRKVTQSAVPTRSRHPSSRMFPPRVNLAALLSRLNRLWRIFVRSARIVPVPGGQRTSSELPFFSTSGCTVEATVRQELALGPVGYFRGLLGAGQLVGAVGQFLREPPVALHFDAELVRLPLLPLGREPLLHFPLLGRPELLRLPLDLLGLLEQ